MKLRSAYLTLVLVATCVLPLPVFAQKSMDSGAWYRTGPWEQALFTEDVAALRKAADANQAPSKAPTTVIFSEGRDTFRVDGSLERRTSVVYRVETDEGIKNWSETEVSWSSWYQEAPKLRVRIVNPDGQVFTINESNFIEVATSGGGEQIYEDRKTLRAPHPNVTLGSIVEEEVTTVTKPYLPGTGVRDSWNFDRGFAVGLSRFLANYPVTAPLHFKATPGLLLQPSLSLDGKVRTVAWEVRNRPSAPTLEKFGPPELRQVDSVLVSSAPSWETLGAAYGAGVEAVLSKAKMTLPADLPLAGKDARAAAVAVSQWINVRVRYTGLELGVNSILPFVPSEVLKRGYGDCKDKATLMVGMLRAAGFRAFLSLLYTGPGWDLEPEVRSLMEFNHAIVYVEEGGGFWIDPTVELNREASLPYYDQYRYTLVAKPTKADLMRTPQATAAENRIEEVREFTMKDDGPAEVVETTKYFGAYDSFHRNDRLFADRKAADQQLLDYGKTYYEAAKVTKSDWVDPYDFSRPFGMSIVVSGSAKATTGETDGQFTVSLNNLKNTVSDELASDKEPERRFPYRFNLPFTYSLKTSVRLPVGFEARTLPEPVKLEDSDFRFRADWSEVGDGTIQGLITFELLRLQYSAKEYKELWRKLASLWKDHYQYTVILDHKAEGLRAEGRYAEAFAVYQDLLAKDPHSAIQNKRLSVALVAASLGEPALYYAKQAVDLNPENADLWANLATIRTSDSLGRRFNKGYDRAGAIAAWKKAIALDPDTKSHLANLAILYEYNEVGDRYQDRESLVLARDAYQGLGPALQEFDLTYNLWLDQVLLEDLAGAKAVVPKLKDEKQRNVAKAVTEVLAGSKSSLTKLLEPNLSLDRRQNYWIEAADVFVSLRRYQDAARFLRQAATANKNAAAIENRADILARVTAQRAQDLSPSSAEGVVRRFLYDYVSRSDRPEALLTRTTSKAFLRTMAERGSTNLIQSLDQLLFSTIGTGAPRGMADFVQCIGQFEVVGDDRLGYRVDVVFDGGRGLRFFVLKENGEYRICSWANAIVPLVEQMVSDVDSKNVDTAIQWFNWFYPPTKVTNPPYLSAEFYTDERLVRTPWLVRLCAAVLQLEGASTAVAQQRLPNLWKDLADRPAFLATAVKQGIPEDLAPSLWISLAYNLGELAGKTKAFDFAIRIAEALKPWLVGDTRFQAWSSFVLASGGRQAEAEVMAEALWAAHPDDSEAFSALLTVYQVNLNFPKIDALTAKYPAKMDANLLNNVAWSDLFRKPSGLPPPQALERARKAVSLLANDPQPYVLHTMATIYATFGRLDEARSMLAQAIELNPGSDPKADDWYVLGLLADGYGFHDAARQAWLKVEDPSQVYFDKTDTVVLARLRLQQKP